MCSSALASTRGELAMRHHRPLPARGAGDEFRITHAGQRSGPLAHAASINSVVPAFKLFFGYNLVGGRLQLTGFTLKPFFKSFEVAPSGGCLHCSGGGHFADAKLKGHTLSEKEVAGKRFMSARTQFIESLTSPGEIGRFKVYGVDTNPFNPHPYVLVSGCTPANLSLTNAQVFNWRHLPRVPCSERLPHGDHVSVSTPLELSANPSAPTQGTISGHAAKKEWLIVFEAQKDNACAPNALAEDLRTGTFLQGQVHPGNFTTTFKTAAATNPGFFCAYLQTGGRVTVTGGTHLPDGRVAAASRRFFYAGDTVAITAAPTATAGQTTTVTVSGSAKVTGEFVYAFFPNSPCAATAQAEHAVDPSVMTAAETHVNYSTPFTVTIPATSPPTVYRCAYLQSGGPVNGAPTGSTLASASATVTVTVPVPPTPDTVGITGPTTASAGQLVQQTVAGTAGHSGEFLYEFNAYAPCQATAQSEYGLDTNVYDQPEGPGAFSTPLHFTVPPNPEGVIYECVYLQSGAPSGGAPTGSTLATGSAQITILDWVQITSIPTTVAPGNMYPVTFMGSTSGSGEYLYTFVPTAPCAATAQAEFALDSNDFALAESQGAFTTPETLTVSPSAPPGTIYECAYLQSGAPLGGGSTGQPTGSTLATASAQMTVS